MPPKKAAVNGVAKKGKAPKTHQLAPELPPGVILHDFFKKDWKLGKPIGSGGFGLLYLASPASDGPVKADANYVVKVEPHSNGPLFCELHFYQRVAKPELIAQWVSSHKLKVLGVPKFVAAGTHEVQGVKCRFMVMERFGTDLQKAFEANGKRFSRKTTIQLGLRLIDALEYVHDKEYVHADIKAANLLTGFSKGKTDNVYLVDYGLATRYTQGDCQHKEYKEDPRKAHDGTIEFTSIDAHKGVPPSRRSDLEILGYCLVQWLCGELPWEDNLSNPNYVRDQKIKHMGNVPAFMKACFAKGESPDEIEKFLKYVNELQYTEKPDYAYLRQILQTGLKKLGLKDDGKLDLSVERQNKLSPVKRGRKKMESSDEADEVDSPPKAARRKGPSAGTPKKTGRGRGSTGQSPVKSRGTPQSRNTPVLKEISPRGKNTPRSPETPAMKRIREAKEAKAAKSSPRSQSAAAKAKKEKETKDKKKKLAMSSVATQTSPGLKGLARSRMKKT